MSISSFNFTFIVMSPDAPGICEVCDSKFGLSEATHIPAG